MNPAGSFTPPTAFNQDIGLGWEYVRITNSSPYKLTVGLGGQGSRTLPEMFLEDVSLTRAFNGKVVITPVAMMAPASIANALTNYVQLDVFGVDEIRHPQAQPITTLANVGNNLSVGIQAASVADDGRTAGSSTVEASVGGVTHLSMLNNGAVQITQTNGVVFELDQALAAATRSYFELHGTDIPQVWRFLMDTAGNWFLNDSTHGRNPIELLAASGGVTLDNGSAGTDGNGNLNAATLKGATGSKLKAISQFTGSGPVTGAAHGLGQTPTAIFITSSTAGSMLTFDWNTAGATTVNIEASAMGIAWVAVAMAF